MNLPWDKSYFKLCFYIIFTFCIIYVFKNAVDLIVYALLNMGGVYRAIIKGTGTVVSVFSVIITGFAFAYILNPPVEFFVRLNFKRGLSILMVLFILIVILSIIGTGLLLNITDMGRYSVYEGINNYKNVYFHNYKELVIFLNNYGIAIPEIKADMVIVGQRITQIFLGFVIAVYFLKDKDKIILNLKYYSKIIPHKVRRVLNYIIENLNNVFYGYVRGQLTDSAIIASVLSFVLSLLNVPFAIPLGIVSGFLNIIPYFGGVFGIILVVSVTALGGEYTKAIYVAIAVLAIQQIDSIFVSPKIVGESVKLSPVVVIIALAVSANIFGLWGMLLAVPIVSFVKIVFDDFINKDIDKTK